MGKVRRHTRTLASGKRVTVRAHSRRGRAGITLAGVVLAAVFVLVLVSVARGG